MCKYLDRILLEREKIVKDLLADNQPHLNYLGSEHRRPLSFLVEQFSKSLLRCGEHFKPVMVSVQNDYFVQFLPGLQSECIEGTFVSLRAVE